MDVGLTQLNGENKNGKDSPYSFRGYKFRTWRFASRTRYGSCYCDQETRQYDSVEDEMDGDKVCTETDQPSVFFP